MYKWIRATVFFVQLVLIIVIAHFPFQVLGQEKVVLTLQQAYRAAEKNYPLLRQKELVSQTQGLNTRNLQGGYLPQLTINGQASYQSDVTKLDLPLPGIKVPQISKDQYRVAGDVSQLLYDGGLISNQERIQKLNAEVDEAKVDVNLYQVKYRAVQLYLTVLYQDELLKQTDLNLANINLGIEKVGAQVKNGVALRSGLQVLQAQFLQTAQKATEIKETRKGVIEALAILTGQNLGDSIVLEKPEVLNVNDTTNGRPELFLFNKQEVQLEAQKKIVKAANLPKLSAFFQGGYGRPGLNLLSNDFDLFYVTGLRLNWSLGRLYNSKRDKQLIDVNKQSIALQRDAFLLNTKTQLVQQEAEIEKYAALVAEDKAIVDLRLSVTQAAKAQLENAVITANDYLREVNAEDAARQTMITHQLQLLQAQVNHLITSGKL